MLRPIADPPPVKAAQEENPRPETSALSTLLPLPEPRPLRILDFDSECMPDAYLGGDLTTRRLTGIAWAWVSDDPYLVPAVSCRLLHRAGTDRQWHIPMLEEFCEAYAEADIVTGHNIRSHDLPIINAACVYYGLPQLPMKYTEDTLRDGPRSGLVFSRSQENLGAMFEILEDKYHMNNHRWKIANTLEPDQVRITQERVVSDVRMHMELRRAMWDRKLLKPAKRWRP